MKLKRLESDARTLILSCRVPPNANPETIRRAIEDAIKRDDDVGEFFIALKFVVDIPPIKKPKHKFSFQYGVDGPPKGKIKVRKG